MKRYKSILLVLFSILACQSEINQNENTNENAIPMSFYAGIEIPKNSSLTKTVLDGSPSDAFRNVLWEYQDEVYVTNGSQSAKFINTSQGTSEIALLEGQLAEGANYFAAYPFNIVINSSASSFSVDLPSEQTYCADGVDSEAFPMVAQCKEGVFNFKNICGILVVKLLGEQTVTSITFSGKDSEGNSLPVAGYGIVSLDYSDVPTLVMENSSDASVSLLCSTGVKLNTTNPTTFHIVLPSGTYDTFDLTIGAKDGSKMVVNSSKSLSIKRSQRTTTASLTYVDAIDLSKKGTANCYIVSKTGKYKFNASVKGNSQESVGTVETAEVLWETFGTDIAPSVGDIVRNISYKDGYIELETPSQLAEGNAVIAAKDASGTILWSWHIWVTDQPEEQIYYNNAGTFMDRNLGATSTTPGDVSALGLLYQWGRKDPFLSTSSIKEYKKVPSTGSWSTISTDSSYGTVEYAVKNPTKFIKSSIYSPQSGDWHYANRNNELWASSKTMYDPCPQGWRVPDNTWSTALGVSKEFGPAHVDSSNKGVNFANEFGNYTTIWYPSVMDLSYGTGSINYFGLVASYWNVKTNGTYAGYMQISLGVYGGGSVYFYTGYRAEGRAVRCVKENTSTPPIETPNEPTNLSADATANCYIVSEAGKYKFNATVKGNSTENIGVVETAEVLWESFGTDVVPSIGDLVRNVNYKDGYIEFDTPSVHKEGNAVIAAKDASGTILWSWHIWLTDQPEEQVYYNNAGTMMDRNLGATSATPGDVEARGLLYQWGRKDPFLGASGTNSTVVIPSTVNDWPSSAPANTRDDMVGYSIVHPTTYISGDAATGFNWSTEDVLWSSDKSIYDPCPSGWRVPDCDVWLNACDCTSSTDFGHSFDLTNNGMDFSGKFSPDSIIWYPATGSRNYMGELKGVKEWGCCWSVTLERGQPQCLFFEDTKWVRPSYYQSAAGANSVRCMKVVD